MTLPDDSVSAFEPERRAWGPDEFVIVGAADEPDEDEDEE